MKHPSHIKNQVNNHPPKGSRITVEPIRKLEDIEAIKQLLKNNPRDYLLFTLGINNGLRAGDLLGLKVWQFRDVEIGSEIHITEQKRHKAQTVKINSPILDALDKYMEFFKPDDEQYLFFSNYDRSRPITVSRMNALVKQWCRKIGLRGNYGSHTLRKTFGTILRKEYKVPWELISKRYGHSSPSVTRTYLGIQDEEVNDIIVKCPI